MFGYVYAPAVAKWPVGQKRMQRVDAGVGSSIAGARAEIAGRFASIANARSRLGMSTHDIGELEASFQKAFRKATSGYWKGGLWDGCWRYRSSIAQHGVYSRVRDQLEVRHPEHLTPSAKRFREILARLDDVLLKEEEAIEHCTRLRDRAAQLEARIFASVCDERAAYADVKADCAVAIAQTSRCLADARRAAALASRQVWPDKKHYGKRFSLSGGLYLAAATVAALALAKVGLVIAVIGFAVTMLIRIVSLGSIRGFDRERGWKATESLLESTKQLLRNEETEMRTYLEGIQAKTSQRLDDMVWNRLGNLMEGQQGMSRDLRSLEHRMSGVEQKLDGMDRRIGDVSGKVEGMDRRVGDLSDKVDGMDRRIDDLSAKVDGMGRSIGNVSDTLGRRIDDVSEKVDRRVGDVSDKVDRLRDSLTDRMDAMSADLRAVAEAQRAHSCGRQASPEATALASDRMPPSRANSWGYYSKNVPHMA
ncbi:MULTISPECIES: apolipoprotein A1/A4/E family protein [Pandoraea]|uniref:apolipoprotein A1/A4/E family protein n=1 Tax=Pandoraea TaxID=93217 RepID=UPI001F5DEEFA|nr:MULTISPECIES: apolipoprotein A1/A4/E family protein [Pandoraea]MCI3204625.1 hypothetical protein [Pandoraea sp. LA3]MDN4582653.1 hypothetical protein [Pandoraea capi]